MKTILLKQNGKELFKYVDDNGNEIIPKKPSSRIDEEIEVLEPDINLLKIVNFKPVIDPEKIAKEQEAKDKATQGETKRARKSILKDKLKNKNASTEEIQEALSMIL